MLLLSVAYAANIGGTGIVTGSPPNLVLPGKLLEMFGPKHPLSFVNWMAFSVPLMLINLFLAFVWLSLYDAIRIKCSKQNENIGNSDEAAVRRYIEAEHRSLGPWRQQEVIILVCFVILVLLWFFRDPKVFSGWISLFPEEVRHIDYFRILYKPFIFFAVCEDWRRDVNHIYGFNSL